MFATARAHLAAMAVAAALLGAGADEIDVGRLTGPVEARAFVRHTPYFPGLESLEQHEIFAPEYARTRKIVLLGASAMDAIGCDASWGKPDRTRDPVRNTHFTCSVVGRINAALEREGVRGVRAFNLARNGTALAPMLYILARLEVLEPALVVYGDSFPFYMRDNATVDALSSEQVAYLDAKLAAPPAVAARWEALKATFRRHGWVPASRPGSAGPDIDPRALRARVTPADLLELGFARLRHAGDVELPPLPVKLYPFEESAPPAGPSTSPDPGLEYFRGVELLADLQRAHGGDFFFYFAPRSFSRRRPDFVRMVNDDFGGYLRERGIAHVSLLDLPLEPGTETCDGTHQTIRGNEVIARALLAALRERHLL